jgi:hypothetical protein
LREGSFDVSRIFSKLNVSARTQAAVYVIKAGFAQKSGVPRAGFCTRAGFCATYASPQQQSTTAPITDSIRANCVIGGPRAV